MAVARDRVYRGWVRTRPTCRAPAAAARVCFRGLLQLAVVLAFASPAMAAPEDLDPTFAGDGTQTVNGGQYDSGNAMALQPDGKIVVVGEGLTGVRGDGWGVVRLLPDGELDSTFS